MLLQNQINSLANFVFNLLICFVSLYLFICLFIFDSFFFFFFFFFAKYKSVVFFSCIVKNTNKLK